ncbi:hypothetical protein Vau01_019900 [Virgisporangium aurantiacum]|uniref:Uncharacterized protein n=1 Tax=Virgisporangium aurantiacum TaxID=175570 RepID=A0A8J4DY23_9ACTN|nr:hypothetical protein Vau01_019900 [Virgisporangium aurantiacum]
MIVEPTTLVSRASRIAPLMNNTISNPLLRAQVVMSVNGATVSVSVMRSGAFAFDGPPRRRPVRVVFLGRV